MFCGGVGVFAGGSFSSVGCGAGSLVGFVSGAGDGPAPGVSVGSRLGVLVVLAAGDGLAPGVSVGSGLGVLVALAVGAGAGMLVGSGVACFPFSASQSCTAPAIDI